MSDVIHFPDIREPGWPFTEEYEDTSLRTKFEDGSMQSRSRFTRSRRKWTLRWNHLPRREYLALMHFITKVVKFSAKSFIWANPDSVSMVYGAGLDPQKEEVEVRITRVGEWKNEAMRYWTGEIEITEV
mgnify:CR=1 FL=1